MEKLSISEIRTFFQEADEQKEEQLIRRFARDSRAGVIALVRKAERHLEALAAERVRLEQMRGYEHKYEGFGLVCGVDEAGRGPLAGRRHRPERRGPV